MPDINRYKSVAVPIKTWENLQELSKTTHRSPAQQIAFLVDFAKQFPAGPDLLKSFSKMNNQEKEYDR